MPISGRRRRMRRSIGRRAGDDCPLHQDAAGARRLEQRKAAQQRAFSRPARADDRDDLAFVDRERDAAEHFEGAEFLAEAFRAKNRRASPALRVGRLPIGAHGMIQHR
jgi:hypothetical protein